MTSDQNNLAWRLMEAGDLASISAMAAVIHTDFHEDDDVYIERLRLHGEGCFVLDGGNGQHAGYAISHPWRLYSMPALNSLLGEIPKQANTYYLHDIALMPQARGTGAAASVVEILAQHARTSGFDTMSLVSVNNSAGFWQKQGFEIRVLPELHAKLRTYSDDACFMIRPLY